MVDQVESVDITDSGDFKYILIRVRDAAGGETHIVRGYSHCTWHADIFDEVNDKLKPLKLKCLGGGRISHDPKVKRIEVYGISQGFGKADHEMAAGILKQKYPQYSIFVNNDD